MLLCVFPTQSGQKSALGYCVNSRQPVSCLLHVNSVTAPAAQVAGLVRSAVNALRTFGNVILLCAQERKRQGKNSGDHSTQALSIQGVRRVYSFVLASP